MSEEPTNYEVPKFKIGDVVQLNSGGPEMTVSISHINGTICMWFTKKHKLKSGTFDPDTLDLV